MFFFCLQLSSFFFFFPFSKSVCSLIFFEKFFVSRSIAATELFFRRPVTANSISIKKSAARGSIRLYEWSSSFLRITGPEPEVYSIILVLLGKYYYIFSTSIVVISCINISRHNSNCWRDFLLLPLLLNARYNISNHSRSGATSLVDIYATEYSAFRELGARRLSAFSFLFSAFLKLRQKHFFCSGNKKKVCFPSCIKSFSLSFRPLFEERQGAPSSFLFSDQGFAKSFGDIRFEKKGKEREKETVPEMCLLLQMISVLLPPRPIFSSFITYTNVWCTYVRMYRRVYISPLMFREQK